MREDLAKPSSETSRRAVAVAAASLLGPTDAGVSNNSFLFRTRWWSLADEEEEVVVVASRGVARGGGLQGRGGQMGGLA